jgi:Ca2+-binding RTX toxin-like protein
VNGGGGDDVIFGHGGDDQLTSGEGDEQLFGAPAKTASSATTASTA